MLYGQGLGNQLFCYITTRTLSLDKNTTFGIHDPNNCIGDKIYNSKGLYFMDLDVGEKVDVSKIKNYYMEEEYRYFINTNFHDATYGCGVWITDQKLKNISDDDCILLGMDPTRTRPENMIHTVFMIPPLAIRPAAKGDFLGGAIRED